MQAIQRAQIHHHAVTVILGSLPLVSLWRLKGVSRAFRRWSSQQLSMPPRVVCVGGAVVDRTAAPPRWTATASVEALDLSTMRWSGAGCMPARPDPRSYRSVSLAADGSCSVVVCGG